MGLFYLRNVGYMCSLTAIKRNVACKNMYDRLSSKGKPKKVILVAVMNKLIRQAHTMIKKDILFDNKLAINP